ncbi:MAG: flagellar hook-associated protein FlgK [Planctomycetes bacterium]|nr:flagellar hook-associated protein FlgK [Planctomycetota bacterium]
MSLINGALQIGRSAITASQAALSVTGNNMANSATPGYSRQRVQLAPTQFTEVIPGKYTGTGVAVTEIRRMVDDALNGRIRTAVGDSASYLIQQQAMERVEATFNELTESDLSTRLNAFFQAWSALQNQPQDIATRSVVIQEGVGLTNFIRGMRSELRNIQTDLDSQVRFQVSEADALAAQVADLNKQVVQAESGRPGSAAALRDQRDSLLKQLGELVNITTREVEGGAVNVFIGNDPLIQYSQSVGLSYQETEDANGNQLAEVVFGHNNQPIEMSGGKIHGLITARDDRVGSIVGDLDNWSSALIFEVNKLHSMGQGLDGLTSVTGRYSLDATDVSLADMTQTGLPWAVDNGIFSIQVTDSSGNTVTTSLKVDIGIDGADTTLDDLVLMLDAVDNINASINGDNRLEIDSDSGFTFGFSAPNNLDDATNVLAALGMNTFFDGYDGITIAIRDGLRGDPRSLAASANGVSGNGGVAGAIATLAIDGVDSLNGLNMMENFNSMIGQIASDARSAQDNYTAADVVVQTLEAERQSISGVSIDEEATNLIIYQRAFQGAARYVALIDEMLDEVMALGR